MCLTGTAIAPAAAIEASAATEEAENNGYDENEHE